MRITIPKTDQFEEIFELIKRSEIVLERFPHFYRIILEYFGNTSVVAMDENGKITGFTFGIISQKEPDLIFLWQIAVDGYNRRQGVAAELIAGLIAAAQKKKCRRMRATVDIENVKSQRLFEKMGFINISNTLKEHSDKHEFPAIFNYYGESEEMVMYELALK